MDGLSTTPDEASIQRLKGLQYGERQLRVDTGYSPTVACAKEVGGGRGVGGVGGGGGGGGVLMKNHAVCTSGRWPLSSLSCNAGTERYIVFSPAQAIHRGGGGGGAGWALMFCISQQLDH